MNKRPVLCLGLFAMIGSADWRIVGSANPPMRQSVNPPSQSAKVHVVRMQGNRFVPAELTIGKGDTVRFIMGGGGPHNVAFHDLKSESADRLRKLMTDQVSDLAGPLLLDPGETYNIVFADVPAGTYPYWCAPHIAAGMKGTITVR
jgi:plastocyanin